MDAFLKEIKSLKSEDSEMAKMSQASLIDMLFRKQVYGKDKARQLNEYDGESMFKGKTLYPGCVYAFQYKALNPVDYNDGNNKFKFYDSLPMILLTRIENNTLIRGLNLNLCTESVRTIILNAVLNYDEDFYVGGHQDMYANHQAPISSKIGRKFLSDEDEEKFYNYIVKECHLKNIDLIKRTYNVNRMKNIRFIEVWQYKYIPFLRYDGEYKKDILEKIYQVMNTQANVKV